MKDNKEGTFILKELASSVKDCAELCQRTQSGSMWTYDEISRMCSVHSTNRYDTNFKKERGHISGSVECAVMTTEEWDQKMFAMCNREYGKALLPGISKNIGDVLTLESQQQCAAEALKTEGAGHWVYNWKNKKCRLRGSDIELADGAVRQVVGNRECGFLSQEQWDKMVTADCKREYDKAIDLSLSEPIKVVNASDQRSCAEEAEGTYGAVFWVYDLKTTQCHLVDGQGTKVDEPGKVFGNYECSVLSEEQWEAMVTKEDCQREQAFKISFSEEALLLTRTVKDEEACAVLTSETGGGLFWNFNQDNLTCQVVDSFDGRVSDIEWATGNRACGLLSPAQWDQIIPRLKPEDRQKLENHLMSPQNCPNSPEGQNTQGGNGHDDAKVSKRPPVIDLFLNPSKSEELRNVMKISEESRTGFIPQVLLTVNNNIVRLQDHFLALFCRRNFRKCIQTYSACSGSRPCPASPPKTHPLLRLTCSGSAGGWAARSILT